MLSKESSFISMQLQKSTLLNTSSKMKAFFGGSEMQRKQFDNTSEDLSILGQIEMLNQSFNGFSESSTKHQNVITSFLNHSFGDLNSKKDFKSNDDLNKLEKIKF